LLGDYNDLNSYYRLFLGTVLRREPIDVTMEFMANLVPHIWTPATKFYVNVLQEIQTQSGYQHLPKIWMDMQASEFCSVNIEGKFEFMKHFSDVLAQVRNGSKVFK
jgi:hypothetical protein